MRYDKRFARVLDLIYDPDIPRRPDGGLALCRRCQRSAYFRGGFLKLLVRDVEMAAAQAVGRRARCR